MVSSPALAFDFRRASLSLHDLLIELQWNPQALKSWPETIERYRTAVRGMPKAFRAHPLVVKSLKEIELLGVEFRRRRADSVREFQERLRRTVALVDEVESSPLVQKILRGETLLPNIKILQWRRKLTHATMGLSFLYFCVYSGASRGLVLSVIIPFILATFSLEILRHLNPGVNRWVLRVFGPIMREGENEKINSAIFYIFSMAIVYFTCPLEVAILTLLFIAVGDPLAGIVGTRWGRHKISPQVSWEGSLTCLAACAGLAALCAGRLFSHPLSGLSLVGFSLLAGLTGAVAEASLKRLDDNLVMPLLSAPVLWGLMKFFSVL